MQEDRWRALAAAQGSLLTRAQRNWLGIDRWAVRHRIETERWVERTATVIGTTTGPLTREQLMWLGVLHGGGAALIGDLTAAEIGGLRNWHRDDVTVLVNQHAHPDGPIAGVRFIRTRRPLGAFRRNDLTLPVCRVEPAILHFAAYQRSTRTAEGVLAAAIQQQVTTPDDLLIWIERMRPLRWAGLFRRALAEIAGGAHSVAEIDVRRMCRAFGLAPPFRQTRRRDASGRLRFTDCEWRLLDGRTLVLEVDGAFHMDVEHWEDDLARQRGLTAPDRVIVRCTAREARENQGDLARDLHNLGVPRAA